MPPVSLKDGEQQINQTFAGATALPPRAALYQELSSPTPNGATKFTSEISSSLMKDVINGTNNVKIVKDPNSKRNNIIYKDTEGETHRFDLEALLVQTDFNSLEIDPTISQEYANKVTLPTLGAATPSYDDFQRKIDTFDELYEESYPAPAGVAYSNSGLSKINGDGSKEYLPYNDLLAIRLYTSSDYTRLNKLMREPNSINPATDNPKKTMADLITLGSAMSKYEMRREHTVIRETNDFNLEKNKSRATVSDTDQWRAPTSTSLVKDTFADREVKNVITNARGVIVAPVSKYPDEHELLLPINTKVTVTRYREHHGTTYLQWQQSNKLDLSAPKSRAEAGFEIYGSNLPSFTGDSSIIYDPIIYIPVSERGDTDGFAVLNELTEKDRHDLEEIRKKTEAQQSLTSKAWGLFGGWGSSKTNNNNKSGGPKIGP